mmetsp:Transcript_23015/g.38950  ORF Transcript_23015/g.38950 Transcript_23015/m.38950 type:complete len:213 (+) Transcript_23015:467-1105(+)
MARRVNAAVQHTAEHEFVDAHGLNQREPPFADLVHSLKTGQRRIDPIGVHPVQTVARALGLVVEHVTLVDFFLDRARGSHQRHHQVAAQRPVKEVGARVGIPNSRSHDCLVQLRQIVTRHRDPALGRQHFTRQQFGHRRALGLVLGLDRDARALWDRQVDPLKHRIVVGVAHGDVVQHDITAQMRYLVRFSLKQCLVNHIARPELLGHDFPP